MALCLVITANSTRSIMPKAPNLPGNNMMNNTANKPIYIRFLKSLSSLIPGDMLKTFIYLNGIHKVRKVLRTAILSFYRIEHIYEVIGDFSKNYRGNFSVLEFGVADGYSFTKMLYATRYLKCENRVTIHGFDSFEGMPKTDDSKDRDLIANDGWVEGQFKTDFEKLSEYCKGKYFNFVFHKGMFDKTITPDFLETLRTHLPILVWIDCDYYTSAKIVFERIKDYLPSGCVIYFDEPEFNYGCRYTGESRLIHEVNNGLFGDGIELVLDPSLSLTSNRIYRFININAKTVYDRVKNLNSAGELHRRSNDSPFP